MNEFTYLVYDGGELTAEFTFLCTAVNFCEGWRANSVAPVDLVDAKTGEVVDTWVEGEWENSKF
jgi:hypothetical protein